ncbi:hypothetical protein OY671_011353 [Metschnikowia pulcherrima]|nr:hypothetical protein OY671_011353 [Metschnikowia pulcherrima]
MSHEQTGVTASYISFIENGKVNPTLDVMAQLADAIGCPVSEIDLLIHIEFWGLSALTGLAFLAGVGPPIVRFVRSVIG